MTLLPFPGETAPPSQAGGKGAALMGMVAAGIPVPEGLVLPTGFFAPWFDAVVSSPAFRSLQGSSDWAPICEEVKAQALTLPLTPLQTQTLEQAREQVAIWGQVAVRSSSPEEDLASASFAGGYETVLGVRAEGLEQAVRRCFVSALDHRVLRYKQSHGFDPFSPRIAVVIQRQLASEVAGVGFSVNPLNNDHDEAVFDACWGLGEAVVSGRTSPDRWVVHKPDGQVLSSVVGDKQLSIWLTEQGVEERLAHRSEEPCLSGSQLLALNDALSQVEEWLGQPVDIEWAFADGALHILQARPITTHLPLLPALMTAPGERRWLYMDASLSNGLTLNVPVSPLGLDWLTEIFTRLLERFMGPLERHDGPDGGVFFGVGGRLYANLSYLFWAQTPGMLERSQSSVDALMGRTLGAVDASRYRSHDLPPFYSPAELLRIPRLIGAAAPLVLRLLRALVSPEAAFARYEQDIARTEARLREPLDPDASFAQVMDQGFTDLMELGFVAIWSALGSLGVGMSLTELLSRGVDPELSMRLQQGFSGNVVVEMGVALQQLAHTLDPADFEDLDALADRLAARSLPAEFLEGWDAFIERYGHRGPVEMDLASPRYRDDPSLALSQLAGMAKGEVDLAGSHARRVVQRTEAFQRLSDLAGPLRRALLRWPNRLMAVYAGTRDTPKFLLTLYNERLRRSALGEGRRLVDAGRLDAPDDVFDLHLAELLQAGEDQALDLRACLQRNRALLAPLRARPIEFPPVIDSRGRIIRPKTEPTPGALVGMGVSPGVARGRVRILHHAEGAVIEPGEVLVAYTTDPGWTPLFAHAGAVILEIGGTLQHGAVVAREYGKPCVVAISQLLERLEDGQEVEVDGTTGVVRLL